MNNDVVMIQLDRPRQLKFTHTAFKTLVSLTGKSIHEIEQVMETLDIEAIEQMVYCALMYDAKNNGEVLDSGKVADLLDLAPTYIHVLNSLHQAWSAAFGVVAAADEQQAPEGKQDPANKPGTTTGKKASA